MIYGRVPYINHFRQRLGKFHSPVLCLPLEMEVIQLQHLTQIKMQLLFLHQILLLLNILLKRLVKRQ